MTRRSLSAVVIHRHTTAYPAWHEQLFSVHLSNGNGLIIMSRGVTTEKQARAVAMRWRRKYLANTQSAVRQ